MPSRPDPVEGRAISARSCGLAGCGKTQPAGGVKGAKAPLVQKASIEFSGENSDRRSPPEESKAAGCGKIASFRSLLGPADWLDDDCPGGGEGEQFADPQAGSIDPCLVVGSDRHEHDLPDRRRVRHRSRLRFELEE